MGRRCVRARARRLGRLLRVTDARTWWSKRRASAPAKSSVPSLRCRPATISRSSAEDNAAFEEALDRAGVEHEIVVYDGAPHSFFDRKQEDFAEASEDAWKRTLAFIARHS